ncbi:uncharacterized protein V1518DRAFT_412254 [Limtongia smithiae]|uniref:uncharacterized protein n=1 Tax=Limtongia smithiae TaxID=1125753 RepID=UPI0034CE9287
MTATQQRLPSMHVPTAGLARADDEDSHLARGAIPPYTPVLAHDSPAPVPQLAYAAAGAAMLQSSYASQRAPYASPQQQQQPSPQQPVLHLQQHLLTQPLAPLQQDPAQHASASQQVPTHASPPQLQAEQPTVASICLCPQVARVPRPRNAFILYRQHHHASVVAEHPGKSNPEISKIIGEQWRHLSPDEKAVWQKLGDVRAQPCLVYLCLSNTLCRKRRSPISSAFLTTAISPDAAASAAAAAAAAPTADQTTAGL